MTRQFDVVVIGTGAAASAVASRCRSVRPSSLQVNDDVLEGRYVVIAAGRKPADLKIPGTEHLTTSEQFLELDELPKRILFIGGDILRLNSLT